jgi:tRNA(Ile)-lysidine synthase
MLERRLLDHGLDLDALEARLWDGLGESVRVGVSGGADSMGLALLLASSGRRVLGVHVDHGLRPGAAAEGAQIARALWPFGIALVERRVQVAQGPNLEARARDARRLALAGAATAHTMDDQAETLLLNLLRGAGLVGLAAMEPGPHHPALELRRHELRAVALAAGVVVLEDPMNRDPRFRRVRVRAELLPLANEIAERDIVPLLARTAEHAREAAAVLAELPPLAPGSLWLAAWVQRVSGLRLSTRHRRALVAVARGEQPAHVLPGGILVRRVGGNLVLSSKGQEVARLGPESLRRQP